MKDCIINSFIIKHENTLDDIHNYIKLRYNLLMLLDIKQHLAILIKHNIIFFDNLYKLSKEGNVILNDNKYYYSKIIFRFLKKHTKHIKYTLKEIRQEQQQLRKYLISNKQHLCILCDKQLPLCLLETAHLKPRCILNHIELKDNHIVEFMCRYCHTLYDNGLLSVHNGILQVSTYLSNYDLCYTNKQIIYYNLHNEPYFRFHYKYIYK